MPYNVQGYADDQVTMVRGKNESTLCELMELALDLVWSCCWIWSQHKCWQDDHNAFHQKDKVQTRLAGSRTHSN